MKRVFRNHSQHMHQLHSQALTGFRTPSVLHFAILCLLALTATSNVRGSISYGSINNFDVVNDTGVECHGFEIEIEDIHSADITYTYNWNHYGTPQISEDNSNALHPKVRVRYSSAKNNDGSWAAYTAIPAGPLAPTNGHQFTNPSVNFGGEHFGVGYRGSPTNISYFWLVDNGSGTLIHGPAVNVSTPTFTYYPPGPAVPAQVQAAIKPAPAPQILEFGPASWVKEIRTSSHNNNEVKLRDLVSDDPDNPSDRNWRNGEPDEVEVEWQILQTDYNKVNGGANGELQGAPEDLPGGDEIITRRYEFYKYIGPVDNETGEAMADSVGPDGIHGVGSKTVNGAVVDLSTVVIVGDYLGAQMSAFDAAASVGLIEQVSDGTIAEPYPARTLVIAGNSPFTSTNWGGLPSGMTFDRVSGELSGTPTESGTFSFTVEATSGNDPVVRKTYTLTILDAGIALPPRSTIDTITSPLDSGFTTGDGTYTNDTPATVTATPAAGYVFANWTENGNIVSSSASYTFTNIVNRSLTANFLPEGPRLFFSSPQSDALAFIWPTNSPGFVLQHTTSLNILPWENVTNDVTVTGTNNQVIINPLSGSAGFYRLIKP